MTGFAIALAALNEMKAAGVLRDYAVSGAMALVFWTTPASRFAWCARSTWWRSTSNPRPGRPSGGSVRPLSAKTLHSTTSACRRS